MSRFQMPPRVAPSPAASEPGHQNAAARLRSSREAQARLLAERRGEAVRDEEDAGKGEGQDPSASPPKTLEAKREGADPERGEGTTGPAAVLQAQVGETQKEKVARKEKLVVMFRLATTVEQRIASLPGTQGVSKDYILRALAKEGRAVLSRLALREELAGFIQLASEFRKLGATEKTVGEAMTVYVRQEIIAAMHAALEDPWIIEPRAAVVGAFLAAIVTRLIEARRAG